MAEIVMPRLSDSMEEGTILTWMKQVGDEVAVGDELVEIETDKANMAYESDVAGTLTKVLAEEGDTLPIGAPIAVVGDDKGSMSQTAGPVTAGDPPLPPVAKASSATVPPTVPPAVS
ncbi:MAG: catalytic domain of component of various dehydrogenase complexe, partial [Solirubrobacterales bacterium]|nr:catalytic domain of component of various dehydrogenase complexe [Solirubrobacterales bacterium]